MFEENFFVLKQEFHDSLSRVILERFLEVFEPNELPPVW